MATHTQLLSLLSAWVLAFGDPQHHCPGAAGPGVGVVVGGGQSVCVRGVGGGSGSEEFFGDRGLMKQELGLKLSCPKLPEFRKERSYSVFYFGSAADPKSWVEGEKGPHSEPTSFKNLAISRLSPCQGTSPNSEQLLSCYLLSHLLCSANFCTCFGLFLCCPISNLSIQVSLPHCFND